MQLFLNLNTLSHFRRKIKSNEGSQANLDIDRPPWNSYRCQNVRQGFGDLERHFLMRLIQKQSRWPSETQSYANSKGPYQLWIDNQYQKITKHDQPGTQVSGLGFVRWPPGSWRTLEGFEQPWQNSQTGWKLYLQFAASKLELLTNMEELSERAVGL